MLLLEIRRSTSVQHNVASWSSNVVLPIIEWQNSLRTGLWLTDKERKLGFRPLCDRLVLSCRCCVDATVILLSTRRAAGADIWRLSAALRSLWRHRDKTAEHLVTPLIRLRASFLGTIRGATGAGGFQCEQASQWHSECHRRVLDLRYISLSPLQTCWMT